MPGIRLLIAGLLGILMLLLIQNKVSAMNSDLSRRADALIAQEPEPALSKKQNTAGADTCKERLPQVSGTLEVDVPAEKVWAAIQARRNSDPGHRKLLSYDGKVAVVKEFFNAMPVIGNAFCTYAEQEILATRTIAYKMLGSDHFRRFEGCWQLAAGPKPGTTVVRLTTTLDPGVRFPFWEQIAQRSMKKDLKDNLAEVAVLAQALAKQATKN